MNEKEWVGVGEWRDRLEVWGEGKVKMEVRGLGEREWIEGS